MYPTPCGLSDKKSYVVGLRGKPLCGTWMKGHHRNSTGAAWGCRRRGEGGERPGGAGAEPPFRGRSGQQLRSPQRHGRPGRGTGRGGGGTTTTTREPGNVTAKRGGAAEGDIARRKKPRDGGARGAGQAQDTGECRGGRAGEGGGLGAVRNGRGAVFGKHPRAERASLRANRAAVPGHLIAGGVVPGLYGACSGSSGSLRVVVSGAGAGRQRTNWVVSLCDLDL